MCYNNNEENNRGDKMGIFKDLFYYGLGRNLSKSHPTAAGIGMVMAHNYLENVEESSKNEREFIISKEKLKESFRSILKENSIYFGADYLKKFENLFETINNLTPSNYKYNKPKIDDFIKECDFHVYACSGAKSLIDPLKTLNGKVKKSTIDTATKMYEKIKQSTFSYETIIYWQDLMDYLQNHNVEITNYEEAKNTIYGKLNK